MNRFLFLFVFALSLSAKFAFGEVVIECREVGPDVICIGNGSLNVSTLGLFSTAQTAGGLTHPEWGSLQVGSASGSPADYYRLPAGVHIGPIGMGSLAAPSMGSSNHWGISGAVNNLGRDHLTVPTGYISGDPLPQSTSLYANETFQSLGLVPGDYSVEWGSGANLDRLTVRIISVLLGDVNRDGSVDLLDVAPFVDLISNSGYQVEADVNQDGMVNLLDVQPFVDLLTGN